ncbi:unnamed protein product [Paramecium octaurelia]|uniref:Uncharacterized protein n=1 Tax=Paramecium octaurelia TaxID=43137 RepID=A0A8S1W1W6_PAROT|nr:unnamed protein product [Paramecium octaurelia]
MRPKQTLKTQILWSLDPSIVTLMEFAVEISQAATTKALVNLLIRTKINRSIILIIFCKLFLNFKSDKLFKQIQHILSYVECLGIYLMDI